MIGGSRCPAVRVELNPRPCSNTASGSRTCARRWPRPTPTRPRGRSRRARPLPDLHQRPGLPGRGLPPAGDRLSQRRRRAALRCGEVARFGREHAQRRLRQRQALGAGHLTASPAPTSSTPSIGVKAELPELKASIPAISIYRSRWTASTTIRASLHDVEITLVISVAPGDPGGVPLPAGRARDPHSERRRAGFAHRHLRRHVSAGLQPRQPVAHGAHHRHRLRGG